MRIEAFSRGKQHARPEDNEDALVVLPGLGYAVLDGVTDRSARRYGGERAGRHASRAVAARIAQELALASRSVTSGEARARHFVEAAAAALREVYERHELLAEAEAVPSIRMGCTLALALHDRDRLTVAAVGDTGIRLTGPDVGTILHTEAKPLDSVTALLRREAWRWAAARGNSRDACQSFSDTVVWNGLAAPPAPLAGALLEAFRAKVSALCRAAWPGVDPAEIDGLIATGIAGQRVFANHAERDLGYGVIDGFDVPDRHVFVESWPIAEIERLEIFSDGYFAVAEGFGVEAWEARFREVEAEDPDKTGAFASTKGSSATAWSDDRTYLGVVFD